MRIIKAIGIIAVIAAFIIGLGIIGRVETEDTQYRRGEIAKEQLTTSEDLVKQIAMAVGIGIAGGVIWAGATYIELSMDERRWRDDE